MYYVIFLKKISSLVASKQKIESLLLKILDILKV